MKTDIKLDTSKLLGAGSVGAKMRGAPKPTARIVLNPSLMLGNTSSGVTMTSAKPASVKPPVKG